MSVYDVVVVGAGPAGSAAALNVLRLRPDATVLLLDAQPFPRDKTCGDGVAAEVFDLLDDLGVRGIRDLGPEAPWLRLRTPSGRAVHRTAPRPNRVITRRILDAALVDAAVAAGAQLRRHRVRSLEFHGDRVVLDGGGVPDGGVPDGGVADGGVPDGGLTARTVIGADGVHSAVRRALGAPHAPPGDTAVAIRGYAPAGGEPGTLTIEYAGDAYPAYAWSFPVAGGGANVGYGVFDKRGAGTRAELLDRLAALLPGQQPDPETLRAHHLPLSTTPRFQPDGRVLLAGDAAATVNPLTGEGIFDAVASGVLAGRNALRGARAGAAHREAMEHTFGRHHRHTAALSRLAAGPVFLDAAIVAASTHRTVFDCAVRLGLARGVVTPSALALVAAHLPGSALRTSRVIRAVRRAAGPAVG